jgi:SEC-C motif domain protein
MKKLNFKQINSVMGKELNPIQKKFIKRNNIKLNPDDKIVKPVRESIRKDKIPGNNDPCPCGSGRKFKLCCKITSS